MDSVAFTIIIRGEKITTSKYNPNNTSSYRQGKSSSLFISSDDFASANAGKENVDINTVIRINSEINLTTYFFFIFISLYFLFAIFSAIFIIFAKRLLSVDLVIGGS